jgi:uncharacterized protein
MNKTRLRVRVVPGAKKIQIQPYADGIKVRLPAPATEGRANEQLIKILAKHYKVKIKAVSIISGLKQKNKVVCIDEAG